MYMCVRVTKGDTGELRPKCSAFVTLTEVEKFVYVTEKVKDES